MDPGPGNIDSSSLAAGKLSDRSVPKERKVEPVCKDLKPVFEFLSGDSIEACPKSQILLRSQNRI